MDRLDRLEKEVEALKAVAEELRKEVTLLRKAYELQKHPVEAFLRQRGLFVLSHGGSLGMLLPPQATIDHKERFYGLMGRYSFRLFLRDLIQFPEGNDLKAISRYCSSSAVRSYLKSLSELGIVQMHAGGGYHLIPRHIVSFGPTLEWYVSQIFQRRFLAPTLFNVRLGQTLCGGDYDVLALLDAYLVYVEVKSSPPRGVEQPAVSAFLSRLRDLQPHLAIFLVDTELRMKDKIVVLFGEALMQTEPRQQDGPAVVKLVDEIFHVHHGIYLINSKKGIYSNLRRCFRDFLHNRKEARPATVSKG